jgi:proline iminopeptidase
MGRGDGEASEAQGARSEVLTMKRTILLLLLLGTAPACLDPTADGNLVPPTVDADATIPRIALNGSLFHAETFGNPAAPVIVMLHGGPGNDYRELIRLRTPVDGVRLEDRYFVVFWDQRGSGLSRRHDPRDVTAAAYDADLEALIDTFSPSRPVVLIGQSWGGQYATDFISKHPERVAGAVLMEPGPLTGALFEEVKGGIVSVDFGSEWLNDYTWGQTTVTPDGHARLDYIRLLGMMGNSQPGFHLSTTDRMPVWRLGAVAYGTLTKGGMSGGKAVWDFTRGLDRYQRPVLFEASELNTVMGVAFQKRQMAFYPDAQLAVVAGAGHDHCWTKPEETLRPVFAYLTAIGF